jgi:hypothetical protein
VATVTHASPVVIVIDPLAPNCALRKWKKIKSDPVELDFKEKFTLEIPNLLEDDDEGKSYSDERCPASCEISVESEKAPSSLWTLQEGKLTISPSEPNHIGSFRFSIKRSGGLGLPSTDLILVTITCKDCCKGIIYEEAGVSV